MQSASEGGLRFTRSRWTCVLAGVGVGLVAAFLAVLATHGFLWFVNTEFGVMGWLFDAPSPWPLGWARAWWFWIWITGMVFGFKATLSCIKARQ